MRQITAQAGACYLKVRARVVDCIRSAATPKRRPREIPTLPKRARPPAVLIAALGLVSVGAAPAAPFSVHFVQVQDDQQTVTIVSDVPADGRASTSFRVQADPGLDATTLQFLPMDLKTDDGLKIERAQIKVTASDTLGALPKDLALSISGLVAPGDYKGSIQVYAAKKTGFQSIPVVLHATKIVAPALTAESSKLDLKLARSCGWFTRWVLGPLACNDRFDLTFGSTGRTTLAPTTSLVIARTDGSLVPVSTKAGPHADNPSLPSVSYATPTVSLHLPDDALPAGNYTGHVRTSFDGGATIVDAPLTISMRWPASMAFVIILLGVLVGRAQAYMAGTGKTIATSYKQLAWVRGRAGRLPDQLSEALTPALDDAYAYLDAQQLAQLTTSVTTAEALVHQLEIVNALIPDLTQATADQQAAVTAILGSVRARDTDDVTAKVRALRGGGGGGVRFAPNVQAGGVQPQGGIRGWIARQDWKTLAIVYGQPVFFIVLLISISLAGLFSLYGGSATIGAAPLADFLTLFAWGLASDVASRTLSNFRGQ